MNVATLQSRLRQAGRDPGPTDGACGPKTLTALLAHLCAGAPPDRIRDVGAALAVELPRQGIWTGLRVQHFLAQALHETTGLVDLHERGGPTYCSKYDGRADLGNCEPGDGYRFRGRGIFQLTGRANYEAMGAQIGVDLVAEPEQAAEPALAVLIACLFWTGRSLNRAADADDIVAVTRKINGGRNGLEDRKAKLAALRALWGASQ